MCSEYGYQFPFRRGCMHVYTLEYLISVNHECLCMLDSYLAVAIKERLTIKYACYSLELISINFPNTVSFLVSQ